ncbi:hypothetical protein TIFTF001_024328 [Ficus carica]|uniref:Uncharacterized protein n=1 Tax=Ficus carica TaxID=3494 RepID=A0AA88AVM1_FICCA|nr:hypothetical protein TIFTF001_024328 [Ficus carica]
MVVVAAMEEAGDGGGQKEEEDEEEEEAGDGGGGGGGGGRKEEEEKEEEEENEGVMVVDEDGGGELQRSGGSGHRSSGDSCGDWKDFRRLFKKIYRDRNPVHVLDLLRDVITADRVCTFSCLPFVKLLLAIFCSCGLVIPLMICRLSLPTLVVNNSTQRMLLNLVAHEMCLSSSHPNYDPWITSYVNLLDLLVDNEQDVKDLKAANVLRNCLSSDSDVAHVINSIGSS